MFRYYLNEEEKEFITFVGYLISTKDCEQENLYVFSINDFYNYTGKKDPNIRKIHYLIKNIMRNIVTKKSNDNEITYLKWFNKIIINRSEIMLEIEEELKKTIQKFYDSKPILFKSKYATYLYCFFDSANFSNDIVVQIDDLYKIMNVEEIKNYKQYFGNFRKIVLNIALKEINEKSPFLVEMDVIKNGKKITHIKFTLKKGGL